MITQQTNQDIFFENIARSTKIAHKFGYSLSHHEFIHKNLDKNPAAATTYINRQINPIQISNKKKQKSQKHQELLKEIDNYEFRKKMLLMQKKKMNKDPSEFSITKLINEKITEYNYLVEHKHIIDKNSEDTQRVLKLKAKSEAEKILEQIRISKKQLLETEDLKSQFSLNKKINSLYKDFNDKLDNWQQGASTSASNRQNKQFRLKPKSEKQETSRGNHRISLQNRPKNMTNKNNSLNVSKFQMDSDPNTEEPFIKKSMIEKNIEEQKTADHNKKVVEVYKVKCSIQRQKLENALKQSKAKMKGLNKSEGFMKNTYKHEEQTQLATINNTQMIDEEQKLRNNKYRQMWLEQIKEQKETREKYFSTFLGKRNRKYKKPWGNKILIKYDSKHEAKTMLGSVSKLKKGEITEEETMANFNKTLKEPSPNKYSLMSESGQTRKKDDHWVIEQMNEEEKDQKFYEIMCKTEKVNLYLKKKKNAK